MARRYRIRYWMERGDFEAPRGRRRVRPGISISDDYGYTDELFIASFIKKDGKTESLLLLSSEGLAEGRPSRQMLLELREQIDHQLECHTEE